eukprot:TRINITY_DN7378_c0_g1_i6.p1 TRINITY_DN7378_c0_g1~~TRINITY_DN7378_c0_g1_i6.p1  ORF type:complete len:448 (+),score=64.01 TRINITY_DN7378_c0_g1_i6:547-1890(+)
MIGMSTVSDSGTLKVLIIYAQTTSALNAIWPSWSASVAVKLLGAANGHTVGLGLPCIWPMIGDAISEQLLYSFVIPGLCLAVLVAYVVSCMCSYIVGKLNRSLPSYLRSVSWRRNHQLADSLDEQPSRYVNLDKMDGESVDSVDAVKFPMNQAVKWWIYIAYFFFFDMATRSLAPFNCIDDPLDTSKSYVQALPWLQCYQMTWDYLAGLSAGMLVMYTAGIPVVVAVILLYYRQRIGDPVVNDKIGFFYVCYKPRYYWFELAIIARRLMLAVFLSVIPHTSLARPTLIVGCFLAALVVQLWVWPFKKRRDNVLEVLSLSAVTLTFVAQTTWWDRTSLMHPAVGYYSQVLSFGVGSDNSILGNSNDAVLVTIVAMVNIVLMGTMAGMLVWPLFKWLGLLLYRHTPLSFKNNINNRNTTIILSLIPSVISQRQTNKQRQLAHSISSPHN